MKVHSIWQFKWPHFLAGGETADLTGVTSQFKAGASGPLLNRTIVNRENVKCRSGDPIEFYFQDSYLSASGTVITFSGKQDNVNCNLPIIVKNIAKNIK